MPSDDERKGRDARRLSSEDLAALIVDALLRAGILRKEDVDRAIEVATEEIDVRKAMRDY
jgi:hypothetical protein